MSSRGSTRGGRGSRAGRGGRGASTTAAASAAAAPSARPSIETPGASSGDSDAAAGASAAAARAVTIDSSASATASPAPDATSTTAASASTRGGRFKPKNIRRDAVERQKLEEERSRDLAAKIKVEERAQRDAERRARRGGGGRGRGDTGGHFARRTANGGTYPQDALKLGGSWGSYGMKPEGGSGYRYQNRRANDVRVNIDALRDNDAPDDTLGSGSKPATTLPVGIMRVEHKEEELKVATSAELEAEEQEDDDEELFVSAPPKTKKDMEMADDSAEKPQDKDLKIKPEPGTQDDVMDIDDIPKAPDSPELKKKPLAADLEKDAKAQAKEKKRERALQDPEAQAMAMDAAALLKGLSLEDGAAAERDNKLFLFQFPPILPPLVRVNKDGSAMVDSEDGQTVDGGVKIKAEPGTAAAGPVPTSSLLPPGGGYIGRLNVRKSGKVELDWGGQLLDLGIATETDFLTTAIIVDEQENEAGQGTATGMGQIYGKFVATPVFQEEDEWDPDLESLGLWV